MKTSPQPTTMKNNLFDLAAPGLTTQRKGHRVDPMDDIFQQARQGSVAAIIQVLNETLAKVGIRTRAVLDRGILQLLCEAERESQLEQTPVVEKVTEILEGIAPRNIRRVNINSRIVREQQLLWLEEIQQDPEGQLLWSELVVLKKPGFWQQWSDHRQSYSPSKRKTPLPSYTPSQSTREQRQFRRGIIGGALLSTILLLVGLGIRTLWPNAADSDRAVTPRTAIAPSPTIETGRAPITNTSPTIDPFAAAVRLAEAAAKEGQTAQTREQWEALAAKWQEASNLMAQVSASDTRYQVAQDRTVRYQENSNAAGAKAAQLP